MDLLLHIGQSKTGTSAIQAFLTLNRPQLERVGITYPSVRVGGTRVDLGSHNSVADSIAGMSAYPFLFADEYAQQFFGDDRSPTTRRMIISGEHFFGGQPRIWGTSSEEEYFEKYRVKVRSVSDFFSDHQVTILIYLRPQVDWLESAISQTIRIHGLLHHPGIYRDDRQFFEASKPLLKYGHLLDIWQEEMPDARIIAVPYVRSQLVENNSVSDFLFRADISAGGLKLGKTQLSVNDSITREYIEVKKLLNLREHSSVRERAIIRCLLRLAQGSNFSAKYTVADDIVHDVIALSEEENRTVNTKYIADGALLAAMSEDRRSAPVPTSEDVQEALAQFEAEFARPRYRLLELDLAARAFLRRNARPVHSLLHQIKRLRRSVAYRAS